MTRRSLRPNVIRLAAVAQELGVHPSTVRRWCEAGEGPAHMRTPRGQYLFKAADVAAWIARHTVQETAAK